MQLPPSCELSLAPSPFPVLLFPFFSGILAPFPSVFPENQYKEPNNFNIFHENQDTMYEHRLGPFSIILHVKDISIKGE
jgi:hypothetical protein